MFTICLHFVHTLFTTDRYNVLKDKGKGYSKRVLKVYSMKQYIKLNSETFEVYNKLGELIGQLYITKTRQEFWTV